MTVRARVGHRRETRVLVAGCAGFSEALRPSLTTDDRFALIGSAATVDDAVAMSTIFAPDVVLVEPDLSQVVPRLGVSSAVVIAVPLDSEVEAESIEDEECHDDGPLGILGVVLALASLGAEDDAPLEISLN